MAATPPDDGPSGRTLGDARHSGRAHGFRTAAAGSRRAAQATARMSARTARFVARRAQRAANAHGAGESGLNRVIWMHALQGAGDALVVIALAGTVFFAVPVGEARGRVALYLLVTMAPFTLLSPLVGPLLDRARNGRRLALAATHVLRAFLAWVMADAVSGNHEALSLYPAAFGYLVITRAYLVARANAIPRVLPPSLSLVSANARVSLSAIVAVMIAGPLGAGLAKLAGPSATLRLAFLVFAAGTVLAVRLPGQVDSSEGEVDARLSSREAGGEAAAAVGGAGRAADTLILGQRDRRKAWSTGPRVVLALRANAALRAFSGFLTLFLAFLLRTHPLGTLSAVVAIGVVAAAAGLGNTVGTSLGALVRRLRAETVLVAMLVITVLATTWGALFYAVIPVVFVGFVAGLSQGMAKISLDSVVQSDVPEPVQASAFARTETVLQLSWVVGGAIGLVLPLSGGWGLGLAAAGLAASLAMTVRSLVLRRR